MAAALSISVGATLLIWFGLEDVPPCALQSDPEVTNVRKVLGQEQKDCFQVARPSATAVYRLPGVGLLLALQFLVFLAFNLFYVAFPVHAATVLDWTLADTGIFFSVMGLMMALAQGPVLRWASQRCSDRSLVVVGGALLAVSFLAFVPGRKDVIYLGTAVLALGNGVMWPSLQSILSRTADRSLQGAVQGLASSAGAVASILGMLLGGLLHGWVGAGVFALSAGITVLAVLLSMGLPGSRKIPASVLPAPARGAG